MTIIIPNTFADKTGQVLLENLDENFTSVVTGVNQVQTTVDNIEDPVAMALIFGPDASGDSSSSSSSSVPAGVIIYTAASTAPDGYIKANGSSLSTSEYSALFAAIGYTYGGSGASFNVPDLRGEFVRAWDDGRGRDSGRSLGSVQSEMINQHKHWISSMAPDDLNLSTTGDNVQEYGLVADAASYSADDPNKATGRYTRNDPGFGTNNETRPRNISLLACIKY
jgi:microcystin-dependent protein